MSNNKISVGVDIDGVLRDFNEGVRRGAKAVLDIDVPAKAFRTRLRGFTATPEKRNLLRMIFGGSDEMMRHVFLEAPPMPNALKGFRMMVNDHKNFDVHIVSSQNEHSAPLTDTWLKNNGIECDNVHYTPTEKKIEAPVSVMIDDYPDTVKRFNDNGKYGVLIRCPANEDVTEMFPVVRDDLLGAYYHLVKQFVL